MGKTKICAASYCPFSNPSAKKIWSFWVDCGKEKPNRWYESMFPQCPEFYGLSCNLEDIVNESTTGSTTAEASTSGSTTPSIGNNTVDIDNKIPRIQLNNADNN